MINKRQKKKRDLKERKAKKKKKKKNTATNNKRPHHLAVSKLMSIFFLPSVYIKNWESVFSQRGKTALSDKHTAKMILFTTP